MAGAGRVRLCMVVCGCQATWMALPGRLSQQHKPVRLGFFRKAASATTHSHRLHTSSTGTHKPNTQTHTRTRMHIHARALAHRPPHALPSTRRIAKSFAWVGRLDLMLLFLPLPRCSFLQWLLPAGAGGGGFPALLQYHR